MKEKKLPSTLQPLELLLCMAYTINVMRDIIIIVLVVEYNPPQALVKVFHIQYIH